MGGTDVWKHPEDLVRLGLLGGRHHGAGTAALPGFLHQLLDVELLDLRDGHRSDVEAGSTVAPPLALARFSGYPGRS